MRIAFRQCLQRTLKRHGISVTFEMLQVMSCLWREEGSTQQILAERTARSKASLSSLMTTSRNAAISNAGRSPPTDATNASTSRPKANASGSASCRS